MITTNDPQTIVNRYTLEFPIGDGGMGVVYRAEDRLTGQLVALKRVTADRDKLHFNRTNSTNDFRLALAKEFHTLASLRHPNIISVLDYGFDAQRQPFYTMELIEGAQNILEYGADKSLLRKIELIGEMLLALAYLHRRGIIHRDLKPDNVLIQNGVVKVVDFGLAVHRDNASVTGDTAGTLAYMSPELFQGGNVSEQSDLFAVGIISCELLCGQAPFTGKSAVEVVTSILNDAPKIDKAIPAPIRAVLEKALEKKPSHRYNDAYAVLDDLSAASGLSLTRESDTLRESFLQGAPFVGRQPELQKLAAALDQAVTGHGSAWLIGGESGVGKSRLVDELRIRGLVNGMLVLHGQAIQETNSADRLWAQPIRRLILNVQLTDGEASLFKKLVPDTEKLIGHSLPDAPEADENTRQRLISTVMELFKRSGPILLILEDLQWAAGTHELLRQLSEAAADFPWLILVTYRDDESPDLPTMLRAMQTMKLERLDTSEIAALTESMIGRTESQADIVDLLARETEGNVFFIIETVRILAEQSGRLRDIAGMTLPERVFSGGMMQVVRTRLARVPANAQPLLKLAAVAGRAIDLPLLSEVMRAESFPMKMDDWLTTCSGAAVLEIHDDRWRFTHDKIRETILHDLSAVERPPLHKMIAMQMERRYAGQRDYAASLVYHWRKAENIQKELLYLPTAAHFALQAGNHIQAAEYFERTRELLARTGEERPLDWLSFLYMVGGWAYLSIGAIPRAKEFFAQQLDFAQRAGNMVDVADAYNNLGTAHWHVNEYTEALRFAHEAEGIAREQDNVAGIGRALNQISYVLRVTGDYHGARQSALEALDAHTQMGNLYGMAEAHNNVGLSAQLSGDFPEALHRFQESLRLNRLIGFNNNLPYTLNNLAIIASTIGDYRKAREYLMECLDIARRSNNLRIQINSLANLGNITLREGDPERAEEYLQDAIAEARKTNNVRMIAWGLERLGAAYLAQRRYEEASETLNESMQVADNSGEGWLIANSQAGLAAFAIHEGDLIEARRMLQNALSINWGLHAVPTVLVNLAMFTELAWNLDEAEQAAQLVGLIEAQPNLNSEAREALAAIKPHLERALPSVLFQREKDMGAKRALGDVVAELIREG